MARSIPTNPEKDPEEIQGLFLSYINSKGSNAHGG
jgi:hypothetical protein